MKHTWQADKDDETSHVVKVPHCIAPGVIAALLDYVSRLPGMGAPPRHVQLAQELTDDLNTQFEFNATEMES